MQRLGQHLLEEALQHVTVTMYSILVLENPSLY